MILLLLVSSLLLAILLWLYIWKKDPQPEPTLWLRLNHSVAKEMAGSNHTPAKLRSSLEAGKKQLRVWLQYICSVTEMFLYSSFNVPLVLLWFPYGDSEMAHNGFEDGSKWYATNNTCSSVNEASFVSPRTHVQELMRLCSCN